MKPPPCLPDSTIDEWLAGSLTGPKLETVRVHLSWCEPCATRTRKRMALRKRGPEPEPATIFEPNPLIPEPTKAPPAQPEPVDVGIAAPRDRLYLELLWGGVLLEARAISPGPRLAPVPGFDVLARRTPEGFEVAGVDVRTAAPVEIPHDGLLLRARLAEPADPLPRLDPRQLPFLALGLTAACLALFAVFLLALPAQGPVADFAEKNLSPVAVRLIAPAPQRKEEATRAAEQIREHVRHKKQPLDSARGERSGAPKAVVAKHFAALAKLTAAGPATKSLLAQMDKFGSAKKGSLKLPPLLGRGPVISASSASLFDFGRSGTLGAEVLHGKGGGGVGAMGAGNIGRGAVSGTVSRATSASLVSHGDLAREALADVINLHLQAVRGCYERALLKVPALAGKLVVEWTVTGSGRVSGAKVKSKTLDSAAVESCVLQQIATWQFPRPARGPVQVTYPFVFSSASF